MSFYNQHLRAAFVHGYPMIALVLLLQMQRTACYAQRNISVAEKETATGAGFTDENGSWKFELYAGNIIKTTFKPKGYENDEQVSNAVILKPVQGKITNVGNRKLQTVLLDKNVRVLWENNTIKYFVNDKLIIMNHEPVQKDGFNSFVLGLQPDEKIFGGGERALPMDRRGQRFNLYNNPWYGYEYGADNLNFSVPFFISSKGYGILFDNPSRGYADIGKSDPYRLEVGFVSGQLNFYIIPGKDPDEILRRYTRLTGTQPIPPRWALGNFMSRFGYRSEEQVKEIYSQMKAERFPVDAVIFDLFWFGDSIKGTMGNLDWVNKEKWPDPPRMIADLKKENTNTILITEPFILRSTPNYEPSKQYHTVDSAGNPFVLKDFYFGEGGLIDIFRKDAQNWFWTKYDKQIKNGVAGWWGDLGEPEKHPSHTFHNLQDLGFKRKFGADEVHNLYGHYWSKMLHEKYASVYPGVRLFHLNRSGFAGSQRYSVFPWTGDVHRNWNGLKAQLPILLGMSLSGIPYIHSDAGGFAMGQKDPELYTRWLQFAAFTPVFRPHGTAFGDVDTSVRNIESEPVFYPEPYKSIIREVIELRYHFAAYNYTLAYEQHMYGRPLMRPMFYHYPADAEAYNANDQYMWGEHVLVAPVFEQQAIEKKVYLPAGNWYNQENNKFEQGGRWLTMEAGIEDIPFFVKEGAFIPSATNSGNLQQYTTKQMRVLYVPSNKLSTYTMYDDDGMTSEPVGKRAFELLNFSGLVHNGRVTIGIRTNGGKFKGRPQERTISFVIPGINKAPASVQLNGAPVKKVLEETAHPNTYFHDTNSLKLYVNIGFTHKPLKIEIKK